MPKKPKAAPKAKKGRKKFSAQALSFNFGANVKKRTGRFKNGASWS
jgi:hypothetical protein